jgi:hypothetical protein
MSCVERQSAKTRKSRDLVVKIDIDKLTERELIELNHRIVERLKFLESVRAHKEMMEFNVGEKVSFHPPGQGVLNGTLIKYNKKTVTVLTEDGQKWNVSPHLLMRTKANDSAARGAGNVIDLKKK